MDRHGGVGRGAGHARGTGGGLSGTLIASSGMKGSGGLFVNLKMGVSKFRNITASVIPLIESGSGHQTGC